MTVFTSVLSFFVLVVCRPTVTVLLLFVCVFCVYCVFCLSVVCCHMLTNKDLYKVNYPREPHIAAATWPFVCLLPFRQRHIVQHIVIPHTVVDSVWPQFRSCFWTFCDRSASVRNDSLKSEKQSLQRHYYNSLWHCV